MNDQKHPHWIHGDCVGGAQSPEYISWMQMKQRCYNSKTPNYKHYGEKGIKVCDRWHAYANFLDDMGRKPSRKYSIGRVNSDGDYDPLNCRWETTTQQARNRRGIKLTMTKAREIRMLHDMGYARRDLAKEFGVSYSTIDAIIWRTRWND